VCVCMGVGVCVEGCAPVELPVSDHVLEMQVCMYVLF